MSEYARKTDILKGYENKGKTIDSILGEVTTYVNSQTDNRILCVDKLITDKETLVKEIENKKKRILDKNDYILNLYDYSVDVQKALCATSYILHLYYEYAPKSLMKEIIDRKNQNPPQTFKMEELTHLMYHQIYANAYLQDRGIYHGDICPHNIAITKKKEYKLAFKGNDMITPERVQLDKLTKNSALYVSPELHQNLLKRQVANKNYNVHKSDVFSLGMTILQAGLMKKLDPVYTKTGVDKVQLESFIDEFESKYSDNPLLYTTVASMLKYDEKERNDFTKIKTAMPDYQEIADYLYKLENGLIVDTEDVYDEDSINQFDPNQSLGNNFNFTDPNQRFINEAPDQDSAYGGGYPPQMQGYPPPPPGMPYPPMPYGYPPVPYGYPPYPGYPPPPPYDPNIPLQETSAPRPPQAPPSVPASATPSAQVSQFKLAPEPPKPPQPVYEAKKTEYEEYGYDYT